MLWIKANLNFLRTVIETRKTVFIAAESRTVNALETTMNGVFAVNKPSGPTSHDIVHKIRDLFNKSSLFEADIKKVTSQYKGGKKSRRQRLPPIKVGHGGTLDPLADGILVIGVGNGTKELPKYLGNCTKVYRATALLGTTTDTYDSEGKVVGRGKTDHITDEMVATALTKLRGDISQIPPIYSALKMGGKKLYEYARSGQPLPREIEARNVTVHELELINGGLQWDHKFSAPAIESPEEERKISIEFEEKSLQSKGLAPPPELFYDGTIPENSKPSPILEIRFSVSSGTYIRTLIHDLGLALGCGAHMVTLTRLQQGNWKVGENAFELTDFTQHPDSYWGPPLQYYLHSGPGETLKNLFPKEEPGPATQDQEENETKEDTALTNVKQKNPDHVQGTETENYKR
ncbi:pseudouridine synthase PUS4 [Sugiyamaella lignohabitans]|uniref:tRNA pseudouridine(55) synthase n=1 Tax=Sugiyamaella lignohabitans TaxID=796027 RepID=A0A167CLJ8_9ASCO|nr:pseudouridine synthase PUS4 [Sugiyamaella lignohabitans]ANB11855.1 pseudouridine synthase PUS4 [Sugiyamaella lignohabitans]